MLSVSIIHLNAHLMNGKNVKLFIFSETFKFAVNSSFLSVRQQWHIPSMVCRFIFPVLNLICNDALEQDKYLLKKRGSLKRFSFHFRQVKRIFFDEFFLFLFLIFLLFSSFYCCFLFLLLIIFVKFSVLCSQSLLLSQKFT